jgi:hypothetical protein
MYIYSVKAVRTPRQQGMVDWVMVSLLRARITVILSGPEGATPSFSPRPREEGGMSQALVLHANSWQQFVN